MRAKRLMAGLGAVGALLMLDAAALSQSTPAQATASEGEACTTKGNTAVSSTSGRAIVCTDLLDNGGGTDGLRWHVQTAANMQTGAEPTTTMASPTTSTPAVTAPPITTVPTTTVGAMPTTGVDTGRWVGEAASLTGLGTALVIAARRRRRGFASPR